MCARLYKLIVTKEFAEQKARIQKSLTKIEFPNENNGASRHLTIENRTVLFVLAAILVFNGRMSGS